MTVWFVGAGPGAPDDAVDGSAGDLPVDAGQRLDADETALDTVGFEQYKRLLHHGGGSQLACFVS